MPPCFYQVGAEVQFPIQPLLTLCQGKGSLLLQGRVGRSDSSLGFHDTRQAGKGRDTLLLLTIGFH